MTTIACNKTSIACDLQITYRDTQKLKCDTKITKVGGPIVKSLFDADEAFIGYAGSLNDWGNVLAWFHDPNTKIPRVRNGEFLALTNKKTIWHSNNFNNWIEFKEPFASIGSGSEFAVGALASGKEPIEACKVASKFDIRTGMGFRTYTF